MPEKIMDHQSLGPNTLTGAAQQEPMPVIGWLSRLRSDQPLPQRDVLAFHEGLADSGFVEGRNVRLEYR
jgi:putative ABC transport system substrate-binding protein